MVPPAPTDWSSPLQDWKVTIRGSERLEEPHVTIFGPGGLVFRLGLRSWTLLDDRPPPRKVPPLLITAIKDRALSWKQLWNHMYPHCVIEIDP